MEEILDLIETHLGAKPDPVLAARAGAVLFGGRPATGEDFERAEVFRREVQVRLRKRRGWPRTMLTWYGVPHRRPARSPAPGTYEVPDLGLSL